jgi:hypothetical protein
MNVRTKADEYFEKLWSAIYDYEGHFGRRPPEGPYFDPRRDDFSLSEYKKYVNQKIKEINRQIKRNEPFPEYMYSIIY